MPKTPDDEFFRDQTAQSFLDPLVTEKVMDLTQEALRINKFTFKPLSVGQRRTVSQRLEELNVDPIAILAALAMGLDPRTGEPLVAVKPMKVRKTTGFNPKTKEPIIEEVIINHEYPGATSETMAFCAKELAGFVYPKLKHVEHQNDLDDRKTFTVVWAGEQPSWAKPRELRLRQSGDVESLSGMRNITQIDITESTKEINNDMADSDTVRHLSKGVPNDNGNGHNTDGSDVP